MPTNEFSEKRERGRPIKADPHWVVGSADILRTQLEHAWPALGNQLLTAQSPEEIMEVLKKPEGGRIGGVKDLIFSTRIFEIIRDPKFPGVRTKSQINFLADSLGADGVVTPRRSREICAIERAKVRHIIVRREFYIECTCGYKGPAQSGECRECGTGELSEELRQREDYGY